MPCVCSRAGYRVQSLVLSDPMEAAGVNDRAQLAVAEAELRDRINERWMRRGVTMWDPERTYVDAEVRLAPDVSLLPGVILRGRCLIGEGSEIGPNCILTDTNVGRHATVSESSCDRAVIGHGAEVGPFCVVHPVRRCLTEQSCRRTRCSRPSSRDRPRDGPAPEAVALEAWSSSRIAGSS